MKRVFLALLLILIVLIVAYFVLYAPKRNKHELVLYGNVDVRQVDLGFQVLGRVIKMHVEEGDQVKAGMLLGVLDKRPYLDQVREAQANAESVRVNFKNAETLLKRRKDLVGNGGVSQEDLENATASYESLAANLKQAEASLAIAVTNLEYTEVFAPTEGVVLTRVREPGTVVNVGDPIYTVSVTSPVWIRAFVAEPDLGRIHFGMEGEVSTDSPGSKVYTGRIGFISPVAEFTPKTVETTQLRTDLVYRLRVYVDHPDSGLLQGMPVTVRLRLDQDATPENRP
jgi:HlyD family secretion protein